jgi:hypothetical protein
MNLTNNSVREVFSFFFNATNDKVVGGNGSGGGGNGFFFHSGVDDTINHLSIAKMICDFFLIELPKVFEFFF